MPSLPVADGLAKATLWPGWFTDQQLAYEQAQHLANALGASVNAGQLAQGWLDMHTSRHKPSRKKKRKHRVLVPGARAVVIPAPTQQVPQSRPQKQSARAYLTSAGVTAAILAALTSVLTSLWAAAWALGWSSAVALIGTGSIRQDAEALALLLAEGKHERIGWMLETRLSRLERILLAALAGKISADELADQIAAVLSSLTSALLVTQTETSWASGAAAYAVYKAAGVQYVHWISRRDARTCGTCLANDYQGPIPLGQLFKSGLKHPPQHPRCRCALAPAQPPKGKGNATAPPPAP